MLDWDRIPECMRCSEVKEYYDVLKKHEKELKIKRVFDVVAASLLFGMLFPVFLVLAIAVKLDSAGPVFFKQTRITQYARKFLILKFRTMEYETEEKGSLVTVKNDPRVTKVGKILRKYRLDELPQLINIINGDMTFVGTRPEVEKYVKAYTNEMKATLLLPAGVTSMASICYKDEEKLLENVENADAVYITKVLPEKMKYNLDAIKKFSLGNEFAILIKTITAVFKD